MPNPSRRTRSTASPPSCDLDLEARFEALFNQQWEPLCRALYRLLGDWAESEDLALEAFLQLYRRPPADEANPVGWLYRVAVNLGLNSVRARKRRRHYEDQAGLQALASGHSASPAQDAERLLEQQQVRRTLQSLRPRSARILLLRYSGLSYAEIAEALEVSQSSVGTLLARAEKEFEQAFITQEESWK
jgi:RNA polymerase sigma factor (sigma-70 family)